MTQNCPICFRSFTQQQLHELLLHVEHCLNSARSAPQDKGGAAAVAVNGDDSEVEIDDESWKRARGSVASAPSSSLLQPPRRSVAQQQRQAAVDLSSDDSDWLTQRQQPEDSRPAASSSSLPATGRDPPPSFRAIPPSSGTPCKQSRPVVASQPAASACLTASSSSAPSAALPSRLSHAASLSLSSSSSSQSSVKQERQGTLQLLSQSQASEEVKEAEETREQEGERDCVLAAEPGHSNGGAAPRLSRAASIARLVRSLPAAAVDTSYLGVSADDSEEQEGEEDWLLAHHDVFDAAMAEARQQLQRILDDAELASILARGRPQLSASAASSPFSSSSSSSSVTLSSVLRKLSQAHAASIAEHRLQHQQRLALARGRARVTQLRAKEQLEQLLRVVEQQQQQLQEELSLIRIEEWQKREEEIALLRRERHRVEDGFSVERIAVEQQLERLQQQQTQLQSQLSQTQLEEERVAMATGQFVRIPLTPSKHWQNTARDGHFRLAESQFLRLASASGSWRVTKVEYIVQPELRRVYAAFLQEEQQRRRAAGDGSPVTEHLTFHGTTAEAVERIIVEGFRIGGVDVPAATGAALGQGVYSSEDPSFASQYIKADSRRGTAAPARRLLLHGGSDAAAVPVSPSTLSLRTGARCCSSPVSVLAATASCTEAQTG